MQVWCVIASMRKSLSEAPLFGVANWGRQTLWFVVASANPAINCNPDVRKVASVRCVFLSSSIQPARSWKQPDSMVCFFWESRHTLSAVLRYDIRIPCNKSCRGRPAALTNCGHQGSWVAGASWNSEFNEHISHVWRAPET